jgi:hypothetical protein
MHVAAARHLDLGDLLHLLKRDFADAILVRLGWPPPVIANGRLYLRDQDNLTSYDIKAK